MRSFRPRDAATLIPLRRSDPEVEVLMDRLEEDGLLLGELDARLERSVMLPRTALFATVHGRHQLLQE